MLKMEGTYEKILVDAKIYGEWRVLGEYRIGASLRRIRLVALLPYEFLSQIAMADQRNNGAQTPLPITHLPSASP